MAFSIGGSSNAALRSLTHMRSAKALMERSIERISSGLKINSAADDAGGLALGMKLSSESTLATTLKNNVDNAKSYTDQQSAALSSISTLVTRMQTLQVSHSNPLATDDDKSGYDEEFKELQQQVYSLSIEKFNGISLFDRGSNLEVSTSTDGAGTKIDLSDLDLQSALAATGASLPTPGTLNLADNSTPLESLADNDIATNLDTILGAVTQLMGESAADSSALSYASSYLDVKATNLEAARSRVMDADATEEELNRSKYEIQYQAAAAALVQANSTQKTVMELLLFGKTGS